MTQTTIERIVAGLEDLDEELMRTGGVEESGGVGMAIERVREISAQDAEPLSTMGPGQPMEMEHLAWRRACLELDAILPPGLQVNDRECDRFVYAIKRWGEELVGLRLTQGSQTISRARDGARNDYPQGGVPMVDD